MPWINIFDPESPFAVSSETQSSVTIPDGVFTYSGGDGVAVWFEAQVTDERNPDENILLRVRNLSYNTTSGKDGLIYTPAVFILPSSEQVNEAAPYPEINFPPESGEVTSWAPATFEFYGAGNTAALTYHNAKYSGDLLEMGETWQFVVEAWDEETPTPPSDDCCKKSGSRLFKGIASKYRANQHQPVRARRFQKRKLQVDFNGAMEQDETITKVTWECYSPWVTFMQGGCISTDGKRVCVDVTLNYPGIGDVKATVETTSGTVENYEFSITVTDAPMYPSAQYIPSNGPYKIVKEA